MINRELLKSSKPISTGIFKNEEKAFASATRILAEQFKKYEFHKTFVENEFKKASDAANYGRNAFIKALETMNANIPLYQLKIKDAFESLQYSQNLIINSLEQAKRYENIGLKLIFKELATVNSSIAYSSLVTSLANNSMKEFDDFINYNRNFAEFTNQLAKEPESVTKDDFENFKQDMIAKYEKSNSESKLFSTFLSFAFFILGIIFDISQKNDEFTPEQKEFITTGFNQIKQELREVMQKDQTKKSIERTATTNVKLRSSNSTKCKAKGLVKKGQEVYVLENRKKWLLVAYIDFETGKPHTGFVYKKYFE